MSDVPNVPATIPEIAPPAPVDPEAEELTALQLPAARTATPQQTVQADRLLSEANMARRRENYREAEAKCREAISLTPGDAAAVEMLGDILQGVARIDEALLAYRRAKRLDSRRAGAERKYADLVIKQEVVPDIAPEILPRSQWVAVLLSLLLPGAGQIYNGERVKGGVLLGLMAVVVGFWMLMGPVSSTTPQISSRGHIRAPSLDSTTMGLVVIGSAIYLYALIDASKGARREVSREGRTGWEV